MAVGDTVSGLVSVGAAGVLDIRPAPGVEWVVHNIYYAGGTVEFYQTDGTNLLKFDSDTTAGARLGMVFHCSNAQWIRIKNISAGSLLVGYDGIQTK